MLGVFLFGRIKFGIFFVRDINLGQGVGGLEPEELIYF
jgi:hypothetical protein